MTDATSQQRTPPAGYRWLVLLACSTAMFGCYYVFDALYPVTPALKEELGIDDTQIGLLDSAYNWAALLTLIAGGVLVDRLGTAKSSVLFAAIGALGGLLIATLPAVMTDMPATAMSIGRFVLGVGSELFIVAATAVVGRWFRAKEVAFAMAIQLVIGRFGSLAADMSPDWFQDLFTGWQPPLLLAAAVGGSWFVLAVVYALLEGKASRDYGVKTVGETEKLVWRDVLRFPKSYWWTVGLCVAFYATIFPFRSFANLYLTEAHGVTEEVAGNLKSWLPLVSMIGMPVFGLFADKVGHRATLLVWGSMLLVPPFLIMGYSDLPLELSMGMLGLAFALVPAVLWPAVTYLVPDSRLGSAYAMLFFCQQAFWSVMSPALGKANEMSDASAENPAGWLPFLWMLTILGSIGVICAIMLWRTERGPDSHGLQDVTPRGPRTGE